MKAFIICSIRSLEADYSRLLWVRSELLSQGYQINEDWLNYRLSFVDNKPKFKQSPSYDYLKVAIDSIQDADLVIIFLSVESAYSATLFKYAVHNGKRVIVIFRYSKHLLKLQMSGINSISYIKATSYKQIKKLL